MKTEGTYVRRYGKTFSVGQCQELVVVKNRVEVFNPFGVYVSVEDNPLALVCLAAHIVDDPTRREV